MLNKIRCRIKKRIIYGERFLRHSHWNTTLRSLIIISLVSLGLSAQAFYWPPKYQEDIENRKARNYSEFTNPFRNTFKMSSDANEKLSVNLSLEFQGPVSEFSGSSFSNTYPVSVQLEMTSIPNSTTPKLVSTDGFAGLVSFASREPVQNISVNEPTITLGSTYVGDVINIVLSADVNNRKYQLSTALTTSILCDGCSEFTLEPLVPYSFEVITNDQNSKLLLDGVHGVIAPFPGTRIFFKQGTLVSIKLEGKTVIGEKAAASIYDPYETDEKLGEEYGLISDYMKALSTREDFLSFFAPAYLKRFSCVPKNNGSSSNFSRIEFTEVSYSHPKYPNHFFRADASGGGGNPYMYLRAEDVMIYAPDGTRLDTNPEVFKPSYLNRYKFEDRALKIQFRGRKADYVGWSLDIPEFGIEPKAISSLGHGVTYELFYLGTEPVVLEKLELITQPGVLHSGGVRVTVPPDFINSLLDPFDHTFEILGQTKPTQIGLRLYSLNGSSYHLVLPETTSDELLDCSVVEQIPNPEYSQTTYL